MNNEMVCYGHAIRPHAPGDGSISFVRAGRLVRDEPGFGQADTLCATGSPVTLGDLTHEVLADALRSDQAEHWLVHEDFGGVKLFQRVERIDADRVELRGRQYRYAGFGSDFSLFAITDRGEMPDQSDRVNVVMGFISNEGAYPAMRAVSTLLGAESGAT